jgi:glutathione S-transferase
MLTLIGQYDSIFVRRIGIALTLYGMTFEHRPWSAFADAERLRAINPLGRVPTMILPDGDVLVDSAGMIDWLDAQVEPERRLFPPQEPQRHRALHIAGLATGLADKAVSLFYERNFHPTASATWSARCQSQMGAVLSALETGAAALAGPYWFGQAISHADIAVACAHHGIGDYHAGHFDLSPWPALAAYCARLETLPAFRSIRQEFIPPS